MGSITVVPILHHTQKEKTNNPTFWTEARNNERTNKQTFKILLTFSEASQYLIGQKITLEKETHATIQGKNLL